MDDNHPLDYIGRVELPLQNQTHYPPTQIEVLGLEQRTVVDVKQTLKCYFHRLRSVELVLLRREGMQKSGNGAKVSDKFPIKISETKETLDILVRC